MIACDMTEAEIARREAEVMRQVAWMQEREAAEQARHARESAGPLAMARELIAIQSARALELARAKFPEWR